MAGSPSTSKGTSTADQRPWVRTGRDHRPVLAVIVGALILAAAA